MEFRELLLTAKAGDQTALEQLFFMYRPLIISRSMVDRVFEEELYQELVLVFFHCIRSYSMDYKE